MFAYVGDSRKDLARLYAGLKKAAEYDRTIPESWKGGKSHRDGWGCVILTNGSLTHYRSKVPIFRDEFTIPAITGKTYAIFHARKRSPKNPAGNPIFSHPFMVESERKVIFLAHNGGLRIKVPPDTVDTEIALREIAKRGGLKEAMPKLQMMKYTTLNLLLLEIDRESRKAEIECFSKWNDPSRDAYSQLYIKDMEGGIAVFSSTMNDGLKGEKFAQENILKL